tara:strand:- start:687 stop:872 length:186 start_codon:yes stop_codon:yes gene_type:complete
LFDKNNLKIILIAPITILISVFLKIFGEIYPNQLLINNYVVLSLVFGPALIVTILLVTKRN